MGSVVSTPENSVSLFQAPLGTDALLELVARGEADVLEKADRWDGVRKVRHALPNEGNTRASLCGDSAWSPNHEGRIREPRGALPSVL